MSAEVWTVVVKVEVSVRKNEFLPGGRLRPIAQSEAEGIAIRAAKSVREEMECADLVASVHVVDGEFAEVRCERL